MEAFGSPGKTTVLSKRTLLNEHFSKVTEGQEKVGEIVNINDKRKTFDISILLYFQSWAIIPTLFE